MVLHTQKNHTNRYNYDSHTVLSGGAAVEVLAHPLARNSALPTMRVRASRLIRAEGANISIKHPMQVRGFPPLIRGALFFLSRFKRFGGLGGVRPGCRSPPRLTLTWRRESGIASDHKHQSASDDVGKKSTCHHVLGIEKEKWSSSASPRKTLAVSSGDSRPTMVADKLV